jgi:prepilin-type N-terminal cleavage/methylation domain-containing protein
MEKGFTLIELLVVVAIIAVLAAIALPAFQGYRVKAFDARAQTDLRNAVTAQEARFNDDEVYGDCSNAGCNNPVLPGFFFSPDVSGSCALSDAGASYQCGFTHAKGTKIYYYTSSVSAFWDTPN